ncbi:DNA-binding protein SMUBP-2 [Dermatophagoides farinae]|uniref:DNA-binding protein SMUBP-2 n=2 Tax=Dermatophagoides farinae TaxID=6954 RepID=A0A922IAQ7_DERFA|nr:DNA-binding protein SMUBP-2 [Dermatophagoides farinae]
MVINKKMTDQSINLDQWVEKQLELIRLEYEEEVFNNEDLLTNNSIDDLAKAGFALRNLKITKEYSENGIRIIRLRLPQEKQNDLNLKKCRLLRGFVGVTVDEQTMPIAIAYAVKVETNSIEIDCDVDLLKQFPNKRFNFVKVVNGVTYNRMVFTLKKMVLRSRYVYLIGLLMGHKPLLNPLMKLRPYVNGLPFSNSQRGLDMIKWFNSNLNNCQKEAVEFALYQQHLAVIHGPPGTGKTTTLTELILQLITRGFRVMVCAPSNVAVDNIFKQLVDSYDKNLCRKYRINPNYSFVRIGHPVRVDPQIHKYLVDKACSSSKKKKSQYERKQIEKKIANANVLMSTLSSSFIYEGNLKYLWNNKDLAKFSFDIVIVDECGQSTEPCTWIPLSFADKCVLAGDHLQLPPTTFSSEATNEGLNISLLERVTKKLFVHCPERVVRMLTVQHRMNELIMQWPSDYFYDGRLVAAPIVASHQLVLKGTRRPLPVLRFIDTVGCDMGEMDSQQKAFRASKGNIYEAKIVCIVIKKLIDQGLPASDIGVITPYRLQTTLIEALMGFQGREKNVIIYSMVRSNEDGSIGFLSEERRLNVAITRARKHLTLIGDSGTVTRRSAALNSFIGYCFQNAIIENGSDYQMQMNQMNYLDQIFAEFKIAKSSQKKEKTKKKKNRRHKKLAPIDSNLANMLNAFLSNNVWLSMQLPTYLNRNQRNHAEKFCKQNRFKFSYKKVWIDSNQTQQCTQMTIFR